MFESRNVLLMVHRESLKVCNNKIMSYTVMFQVHKYVLSNTIGFSVCNVSLEMYNCSQSMLSVESKESVLEYSRAVLTYEQSLL